ncbi:MAG: glycosyl hydrolase, partial [Ferruginibacter sp.]
SYLARSSYMLQQGKFVADIIYYYGEDNNITSLFTNRLPVIPEGYNYDFVNADALLHLLNVNNDQIVTPSGMNYRLLALDSNSVRMTLVVLKKISQLVKAGAVVVGPAPAGSPGLGDAADEYGAIVKELWGAGEDIRNVGKGKVFNGKTIQQALDALKVAPDFQYTKPQANTDILYVHRKLSNQEFYWINNRTDVVQDIEATFRITGRPVEIWHPETGKTEQASYSFAGGNTKVPLRLEPNDAVFVVFKGNTAVASRVVPPLKETQLTLIDNNWQLKFQAGRGAPLQAPVGKLGSWTENTDAGIKYFSGTGTYSNTLVADKTWFSKSASLVLDLGDVKNLAEVFVNGKSAGIVWKKPFKIDVAKVLKPGSNTLEIKVTNLWVNRLIGDQQPGATNTITYTTMPFYRATSPLLPSGLFGPVRILSVQ